MRSLHNGLATMMTAGALLIFPATNTHLTRTVSRAPDDPRGVYAPTAKEFYMTADEFGYIRPGLKITVNSITIDADLHPVVDINFTDDMNQPLDRKGQITPGPLSINMILAWWDAGTRNYTSYTTRVRIGGPGTPFEGVPVTGAGNDVGGTWNDIDLGHSIYTFHTALPADYDQTITTTLGIYATRNMTGIQTKNYYDNVEQDFVPDGAPVTEVWDELANSACNTCHNPLAEHGGARRDVKLCVLCHSPQTVDPATHRTVDFKVMVHKIHRGEDLPSVQAGIPYVIENTDFSEVVFPQDIRNCTTCHAAPATQTNVWYTYPARVPCGACHDNIDWVTGENHPGGPQPNDNQCASCHQPVGDREWDASVQGAHTVPYKSTQLKGLHSEIVSVSNAAPGQKPTVVFRVFENDGTPVAPASFTTPTGTSNLNLLMGGATADYAVNPTRQRADGASFDGTTATFTFTTAIPDTATGSWAFSIEARRTVVLNPAPPEGANFTEGAFNPVHYENLSGGTPEPRRVVVDLANCNTCHDRLALHGGQRFNTQECVMCHNPNASDVARRPADQAPAESIDFKRMIHRIHTGEELTQDLTIFGFGGSPNNYNELLFPGDRRDCVKCHAAGTQQVLEDPPPGLLPTVTLRDWYTPQQHNAAACLGCHDSQAAAAHAYVMTAPFGEACAACHGANADFSVDKAHAR